MRLPKQAPPAKRTVNRFAGVHFSGNVRPSGFLDILKGAAGGALNALG